MEEQDYMINPMNEQLRRIVLSGSIREDTAAHFLDQITAYEFTDVNKPITIYIDTYGGNVDAAITMYDAIKSCSCPIITIGIGKVMSAGTLLLVSGDKTKRFITENTRVMIHQVSGGIMGTVSEMETAISETKRLYELYIELLSKNTGVPKKQLVEDMSKDCYLTAHQAIDYGLADSLVKTRKYLKKQGEAKKSIRKSR